jgi:integrase/recombinase XerC
MYMASMRYKKDKSGQVLKVGNEIRATRWSALNTFFVYLKSNGIIDNNPVEQTLRPSCKKEKKVTYLSEDEIQICLDNIIACARQKMVNRDMCIVSLGIASGLRVSAIVQINMEDVNLQDCTIKVTEKGNKHRVIHFGKKLKDKLLLWIGDREKYFSEIDTNALFISQKKQRISVAAVEKLIEKYTINIDKKITPHKLRATCATNLYKKTNDIYLVATQLGHANIATTKIYTEVDTDSKLKAAQILDNFI